MWNQKNKYYVIPSTDPYLGKKAIISDTNIYYRNNIQSSFQFRLLLGEGDSYEISFSQKFDFEINKDGGIIETSYNNGVTWQNILFDTLIQNNLEVLYNFYNSEDLISSFQNQPGFTGLQSDLKRVMITFKANKSIHGTTMLLKFSIATDSNDNHHEGWMLDDFRFGGIINDNIETYDFDEGIQIYPNPVKNVLAVKSTIEDVIRIRIVSLLGITILEEKGIHLNLLDLSGLNPGIYLLICDGVKENRWIYKIQKI